MRPRPHLGDIMTCANAACVVGGNGDQRELQKYSTQRLVVWLSESARRPVRYRVREDGGC